MDQGRVPGKRPTYSPMANGEHVASGTGKLVGKSTVKLIWWVTGEHVDQTSGKMLTELLLNMLSESLSNISPVNQKSDEHEFSCLSG